jgi:hypothetical protein
MMDRYFKQMKIGELNEHFNQKVVQVYEKQRPVDLDRVLQIENLMYGIFEAHKKISLRGCIVFGFLFNRYYLLDGQHRYHAFLNLHKKIGLNFEVMCEIIVVNSTDQLFQEFVYINKAIPVPISYTNPSETVDTITKWVDQNYPGTLVEKKIIPKLVREHFRDALTVLVSACPNNTAEQFIQTLVHTEQYIKENIEKDLNCFLVTAAGHNVKNRNSIRKQLETNKMNGRLYIGLYYNKAWMDLFQILNRQGK